MIYRRQLVPVAGAAAVGLAGAVWAGFRRMGSMDDLAAATRAMRRPLSADPAPRDLVRFATLAANSHNTQAWSFRIAGSTIDILPDLARATPAVDPDNHHLFTSLGCAAENLAVVAASRGMPGEVGSDPAHGGRVVFAHRTGAATDGALSDAIPLRQSTRGPYDGSTLTSPGLCQRKPA